ncbi:hypothetical protein ABT364_05580 [Massilia sp. SR12]
MITTNETHEVKPFSFMPISGFKTWRTAGLDVWRPYYLMSFACKEGRTWISQAMLLWCEQDLIGFCEQAGSSKIIKIHKITKLVPPKSGHIAMWDAVAIREIWNYGDRSDDVDLLLIADDANQQTKLQVIDHSSSREMEKLFDAKLNSNSVIL